MSLSETILPYHNPVTPTTSSSSTIMSSTIDETPTGATPCFFKSNLVSWRVLGGIFATVLVVGWVFIIVILIQEEKWQLVLVAWLLLYAAAHFCYWYFKRHHLLSLHSQICGRARANMGSVGPMEKALDAPPSYEDIIKSEPPPPTYYSVVDESPKLSSMKSSSKFTLFSFQSLPKVFGRSSSSSSNETASTSSGSIHSSPSSIKCFGQGKPCSCSAIAYGHDISNQVPRRKSFEQGPPSYYDTFGGFAEAQISDQSMSQSSTIGSSGEGYKSRKVHPILSPIYKQMQSSYSIESPCTSQGYFNTKKFSSASSSSCESSPCTRHGHSSLKKTSSTSITSTSSAPCTPQGHSHPKKISSVSTLSSPCSLHPNLTNKKSSSSSICSTESYSSLRNS